MNSTFFRHFRISTLKFSGCMHALRKREYGNRAASEHDALPVSVLTRMRARGRLTVHATRAMHDSCMSPAAMRVPGMQTPEIILSLGGLGKSPGDRENHRAGPGWDDRASGMRCESIATSTSRYACHARKLPGQINQTWGTYLQLVPGDIDRLIKSRKVEHTHCDV